MRRFFILLSPFALLLQAMATPITVRKAEPVSLDQSPKGTLFPAGQLAAGDQKILRVLSSLSLSQLEELMEAYARLNNRRMVAPLIRQILVQEPSHRRARQLAVTLMDAAEIPDDIEAGIANQLIRDRRHKDAVIILKKLKKERYRGRPFRYQQDLAYALYESGDFAEAHAAFAEILGDRTASQSARNDARRTVRMMMTDAIMRRGEGALTRREFAQALKFAEQLLAANPKDADAVALKAAALSLGGSKRQAVDYLMEMKANYMDFFPHQRALGDSLYEAKMFDDAEVAYRVILSDRRYTPEERVDAERRLKELARDRRILSGENALRRRDMPQALAILDQLKPYAKHPDVIAFRASILTKQRRFAEARALLQGITNSKYPGGKFFESRPELAVAQANTGAWGAAAANFTAVEADQRNGIQTRNEAARIGREMRARIRPTHSADFRYERNSEGTLWSGETEVSSGVIADQNIVFLRGWWDDIGLGRQEIISRKDEERYLAEVAWRRIIGRGYFAEVAVGGGSEGLAYGASIGRYELPGAGWELKWRTNERATDSLQLMALGGVQDSVAFNIHRKLAERWFLDATLRWRQVSVGGVDFGKGVDIDYMIAYTLLEEKVNCPEVTLAYFAEIQEFARAPLTENLLDRLLRRTRREDGAEDGLIDRHINRHGLMLTISKMFNSKFTGYVSGGVSYEFHSRTPEARIGAGIEAFVGKNATMTLSVDYMTSGNASNRDSGVLSAMLGMRISF